MFGLSKKFKITNIHLNESNKEEIAKEFYAFDLETTGLDPKDDRIVQISIIHFKKGRKVDEYTSYINADKPMSIEAQRVNQIDPRVLKKSPVEEVVMKEAASFMKDALKGNIVIVGHNAHRFDALFLVNAMNRSGIAGNVECIDTLVEARKYVKGCWRYNLESLCKKFEINLKRAHDASSDATACGYLLLEIISRI